MIITLSRQMGSEGDAIAARVAAALNLQLIDRAFIYRAALQAGVPDDLLHRLMYEGQQTLGGRILESLTGRPPELATRVPAPPNPLDGIFAPMLPPAMISLEESVRKVGLIIKDVAGQGNVLILGQGGQVWLKSCPRVCHVQIVAPLELRVARIAERERISLSMAKRRVRASDLARTDYMARYHGVSWLDPLLYHIVINTGLVTIETAVALVIQTAQAIEGEATRLANRHDGPVSATVKASVPAEPR